MNIDRTQDRTPMEVLPSVSSTPNSQTSPVAHSEAVRAAFDLTALYAAMPTVTASPAQKQRITRAISVEPKLVDAVTALKRGSFSPKEQLAITQELMEFLSEFEENKFIHADIKPDTLLLQRDDDSRQYVLAGIESSSTSSSFGKFHVMGTRAYKPPHAFYTQTQNYDNKIDSWSAGVTLLILCACPTKLQEFKDLLKLYNGSDKNKKNDIVFDHIHPWIEARRQELAQYYSTSTMCKLFYHLLDPNPNTSYSASQAVTLSRQLKEKDFFTFL